MTSPWRVRNSSGPDGSGQSRTMSRPPGRSAAHAARQHPRGIGQLVERVLEVREVVLARVDPGRWPAPGGSRSDRRALRPRWSPGHGRPNRLRTRRRPARARGNRRAMATSQRPPAAMDVDDPAAARQVGGELRQRGEHLLEEDRDVLAGQALDRLRDSGPAARRWACPVRKKSTIPPQSIEATTAWTNCPPRKSARSSSSRISATSSSMRQAAVVEAARGRGRRRPRTRRPRPPAPVAVALASSSGVMPASPAARMRGEQPQLDAEVDQPRTVETTETGDEVVEAVLVAHRRIVAWASWRPASRTWLSGVPWVRATERLGPRFYQVMDADDRLIADLADDLDSAFEGLVLAHQDRLYTIALRMLGDRGDAEEAAQDALVRAYRALASYDRARIGQLRLRRGSRRSSSTVVGRSAVAVRPADLGRSSIEGDARPSGRTRGTRRRGTDRGRRAARRARALGGPAGCPPDGLSHRHRPSPRRRTVVSRGCRGTRPARGHGQGPGPSRDRHCCERCSRRNRATSSRR